MLVALSRYNGTLWTAISWSTTSMSNASKIPGDFDTKRATTD